MKRRTVVFSAPYQIEVREEPQPAPAHHEVLVQTLLTGISAGTELLVYRDEFPWDIPVDQAIGALDGAFSYPIKYGYCLVGRIVALGPEVPAVWQDRLVFSFHPHESHFSARLEDVIPVPDGISPEMAVFLPNMETAVTLVLDGQPLIGERVVVLGQGIVGLLVTALLARFPLADLLTVDRYPARRELSLNLGAQASLGPDEGPAIRQRMPAGADLSYELSGSPAALDQAIAITGYSGRVVIGSWYGQKQAALSLGAHFHRSRMRLISSQVSTIAPELRGRWSSQRRFEVAWDMIRAVRPERFITHRVPVQNAGQAYRLLDETPDQALQVVLTYDPV
jgi:2-desacetyl-2-hydroxyethyl bacteriochlorophyllide A dehydrogenase